MSEIWRAAPGYEGRYEVSSLGRIRSLDRVEPVIREGRLMPRRLRGRLLAPMKHTEGYLQVSLRIGKKMRTVRLHRLIALAFHGAKRNILHREVAHLDGDASNARADNLRWVSKVENMSHKKLHGTLLTGERHPHARLTDASATWAIDQMTRGVSDAGIAAALSVSPHTIDCIRRGRNWRHLPRPPSFPRVRQHGERNPNSKLSDAARSAIQKRVSDGEGWQKLAEEFGISRASVYRVASTQRYA